jgi:hypothetical protein
MEPQTLVAMEEVFQLMPMPMQLRQLHQMMAPPKVATRQPMLPLPLPMLPPLMALEVMEMAAMVMAVGMVPVVNNRK